MSGDELGFAEISDVHRNERRSKVLTKLPANFYAKADAHLAALKSECRSSDPDPTNPKTMMLQDQISKLDKRLRQIYDMRERKVALAALDSVLGAPAPENMTKNDRALYERLIELLRSFRNGTGTQLEAPCAAPAPGPAPAPAECVERTAPVEAKSAEEPLDVRPADEGMMVQVLEDIPTFVGVNVTYELRKDELVTLPSQFANLLSARGKVRIIGA
jgi:DNA replication initiation complex subunit (GINS family)